MNVGIIGGADGPTAIYVTSAVNWGLLIGAAIAVAAIVTAIIVLKRRRNRTEK